MSVQIWAGIEPLVEVIYHEGTGIRFDRSTSARGTMTFGALLSKSTLVTGERVQVRLAGGIIWAGEILTVTNSRIGNNQHYDTLQVAQCGTWEVRLERRLVGPIVFDGMSDADIVNYLVTTYSDNTGIHAGTIVSGVSAADIGSLKISGMTMAAVLDELGSRGNCSWYVDDDLLLQYLPKDSVTTSTLSLTTANHNFQNPSVVETGEDYCNAVHIQVSWDGIPAESHTFNGDGSSLIFTIPDVDIPPPTPQLVDHIDTIKLNGIEQSVGIYGVDSNTATPPTGDKSFYYKIGDNRIWADGGIPTLQTTDELQVNYYVIGRNVITWQEDAEIAARAAIEDSDGLYQHFIDDSGNVDQVGALMKAQEYIKRRAPGLNGAAAGTLAKSYTISCYSWQANANDIRPGNVVTVNVTNSPTTGGAKAVLIQAMSGKYVVGLSPDGERGYFEYTLQAIDYVEVQDGVEFFKQFLDSGNPSTRGTIAGGGVTSVSGGTGSKKLPVSETPAGICNGYNTIFTTTWEMEIEPFNPINPRPETHVMVNGVELRAYGDDNVTPLDYVASGNIITLTKAPRLGSWIYVHYFRTNRKVTGPIVGMDMYVLSNWGFVTAGHDGWSNGGSEGSIGVPSIQAGWRLLDRLTDTVVGASVSYSGGGGYELPYVPHDSGHPTTQGYVGWLGHGVFLPSTTGADADPTYFASSPYIPHPGYKIGWQVAMWVDGSTAAAGPPFPTLYVIDAYMKLTYANGTVRIIRPDTCTAYREDPYGGLGDPSPRDQVLFRNAPATGGAAIEQYYHSALSDYAYVVFSGFPIIDMDIP